MVCFVWGLFLFFVFFGGGCTRSYSIRMIYKQIYLTHRWSPDWYFHSGSKWTASNDNKIILHISSEGSPHDKVDNVLDCDIEVKEFKLQFPLQLIPLGKV